jgi:hypothetical protein
LNILIVMAAMWLGHEHVDLFADHFSRA